MSKCIIVTSCLVTYVSHTVTFILYNYRFEKSLLSLKFKSNVERLMIQKNKRIISITEDKIVLIKIVFITFQ